MTKFNVEKTTTTMNNDIRYRLQHLNKFQLYQTFQPNKFNIHCYPNKKSSKLNGIQKRVTIFLS